MGSKRRASLESKSEEESTMEIDEKIDTEVSEPSRKKLKKEKRKKDKQDIEISSMERKKINKALDKGRHLAEAKTKPKPNLEQKDDGIGEESMEKVDNIASSSSNGLPEFHVGVFRNFTSIDASVRDSAAELMVTELIEIQKAYDKSEIKESEEEDKLKLEAEKDDGLNNCAPSVRYAVRRLIRGVSSSNECARQGFALGLAILVGAIPSIKIESLLKLIIDLLEVTSSMKGQEARDCYLGRLFAYGAIARSGRLINEWVSNKEGPTLQQFTSALISLASKKRYLQEPAVAILLELVSKLPVEAVSTQILEAPGVHEWFENKTKDENPTDEKPKDGKAKDGNPDALLLALKIQEKLGIEDTNNTFGKLLPSPYSSSSLFSVEHLTSLTNCLKESTFCQPRVHSVWPLLIDILLPDTVLTEADSSSALNSSKKHKKTRKGEEDISQNLRNFCEIVIENSLLTSSHDRKHLALDLILLLLPKIPISCVEQVLSNKVVQCLMDALSTKGSWLFKVSQHFLNKLSEWVKEDDVRKVGVIMAIQKHSNGKFDCITRTKTVKDLMMEFKTESGCTLLIENLIDMFLDDGQTSEEPSDQSQTTDESSIEEINLGTSEFLKSWVVDYLPNVIKHLKLDGEAKFRVQKDIMKFLAVQGLFTSSLGSEVTSFELQEKFKWPKGSISSALRKVCVEQLQSLLSIAQKGEVLNVVSVSVSDSGTEEENDLGTYFVKFFNTLSNIPSVSLFRALSGDDEKAFNELQAMESWYTKEETNVGPKSNTNKLYNKLHSLKYLLIQLLLQILLRPGEFSEATSELIICCKKAFDPDLMEEEEEEEEEDDDEEDGSHTPKVMDVLLDTMLSLLPESSAPMRSAIEMVFKCFCNDITDDGLLRMLRVIKKDLKPARHQNSDDDSDDSDEEEDDDDLLAIEDAKESDEEAEETGGTGDDSDDDEDDSKNIPARNGEVPEDSDDDDDDSDEDSDDGMDDEAMFRMDTYLAKIFREKKNQAGGETAHSQLVLFKLRVLSLLEIYLHENPGKQQVVKVFSSLAQAFVNPHTTEGSEQLGQRILGILQKKIFKAKEFPNGEDIQLSVLESLLKRNLKLAAKPFKRKKSAQALSKKKQLISKNRHKMIVSLAQNSTYWILKIIDSGNFSKAELKKVFNIFKEVIASYFDNKKSQLKSEFLKEIFRRRPWVGHKLIGFLIEKCCSAKMKYRQIEALPLINEALRLLLSANADLASQRRAQRKLRSLIPKLCDLVKVLVLNMPNKQSKRVDVRKFCGKVFQILTSLNLASTFFIGLEVEAKTACESQLGEVFKALKNNVVNP